MASFVIKNNVKHFQASDPKNLLRLLEEKSNQISIQKKEIEKIIPQIEERKKYKEETQEATVYEGFGGLKSVMNLILDSHKTGEEYQVFMLGESLNNIKLMRFFRDYHKKRIEKGIKVRLMSQEGYRENVQKNWKFKGMKIRFTKQKLPIGTFIFKGHVMTLIYGEKPTAFVVKSRKNYEYYKEFFEELWKLAKK